MRLSWRDAIGTLLVAAAVCVTLSVAYSWHWPLIGDARAGATALFVLSYPSCLVAQAPARMAAAFRHEAEWGAFVPIASGLGALALVLMVLAAIANSIPILVAASIAVVAIWAVTTADRLVETMRGPALQAGS